MVKVIRLSRDDKKPSQQLNNALQIAAANQQSQQFSSDKHAKDSASRVLKYLDDYRSSNDTKALREEGYEIDYDRLVGVGANSAVFLAHSVSSQAPPPDKNGLRPLYTPGYDIAAKVVAKKWISSKRPSKTRTGNLKLALALGQTRPENNILKVIDVFKTPERIFIFMQYCAYGNVISFIRRNGQVPSRLAQRWSSQMASALSFLHRFHVAHRNYKLENVLIEDNLNAKLTGFGLSKFCIDLQTKQPVMSRTICGSEPYLAPEMLKDSAERLYDPKQADVWAFGVGLFLCITKRYPFEAESLRAMKMEQLSRRYLERDTKKRLRSATKELLNVIFTIEPSQRPTMQELCNQYPWLNYSSSSQRNQIAPGPAYSSPAGPPDRPKQAPRQGPSQRQRQQRDRENASPVLMEPSHNEVQLDHLNPVTPVAYQPTDALKVEKSRLD